MSVIYKDHPIRSDYKSMSTKALKALWADLLGKAPIDRYLLSESVKVIKGEKVGYLTGVQYMTANLKIGKDHTCAGEKKAKCGEWCLVMSGHMAGKGAIEARADRLALLTRNPSLYFELLSRELRALEKRAARKGFKPAGRLNGTTDLDWTRITFEGRTIFEHFPGITWYDYTKVPTIAENYSRAGVSITFSFYKKVPIDTLIGLLDRGVNIAIAYRDRLPIAQVLGGRMVDVINGDEHDLRFLDRRGVIVGLKYKNQTMHDRAREVNQTTDQSGFIVSSDYVIQ